MGGHLVCYGERAGRVMSYNKISIRFNHRDWGQRGGIDNMSILRLPPVLSIGPDIGLTFGMLRGEGGGGGGVIQ